ncbi:hypothetical protein H6F77_08925 [Microcoleus sp. FACHB-831]|uniref:hypothetical protein n=1 Tax=Microcoleus sp. FACHB-831 TaxID=2692827 RepID=UPI001689FC9C|nr:hypothetical protein [Microcoleus sp. FACHB-831]MBD1921214.1 hypothetical protein [Microcoleus sp. FACHB-831]
MKIRQIPHYTKPDESIIIIDEAETDSFLSDLEADLIADFNATKTQEIVGFDQIYIDLQIEGSIVTLAYDSMAGLSLECTDKILREKIITYLKNLLHI